MSVDMEKRSGKLRGFYHLWLRLVRSMRFYKIMNITLSNCQLNKNIFSVYYNGISMWKTVLPDLLS